MGNFKTVVLPDLDKRDLANLLVLNSLEGFGKGVEIGVRGGDFSYMLMRALPAVNLYGIDPYIRLKGYLDIVRKETFNKYEQEAHEKLDQFSNYTFIKKTGFEAAKDFDDGSLDFVYIDANHGYDYVLIDIQTWIKKVRRGGILCGDDYLRRKNSKYYAVVEAVNDYCRANGVKTLLVFRGEEVPQWLFYKK